MGIFGCRAVLTGDVIDFQTLFLSSQGRSAPQEFGRGLILLTGAVLILRILTVYVSPSFNIIEMTLIYCYACLFSKRLHDAGQSGWLYIVFAFGWLIASGLLQAVFMSLLAPEGMALMSELWGLLLLGKSEEATTFMQTNAQVIQQAILLPDLLSFLVASGLVGFAAYSMTSDPKQNRYGRPTRSA